MYQESVLLAASFIEWGQVSSSKAFEMYQWHLSLPPPTAVA